MKNQITRRHFIGTSSAAAAGLFFIGKASSFGRNKISPNEKLNIGVIAVANRAGEDLKEVSSQNIVALCDIDDNYLGAVAKNYPGAKTYNDFRKLLEQKDIDAVVVGTPDHTHAVATAAALKSGRHVYCEKPLTHTVSEARIISQLAKKHKAVTQMGNQIHASDNYRRVVELVQSGAIGEVREVHVWVSATYGNIGKPVTAPVPSNLHYDLWLGPLEPVPYSPNYVPFKWRNYWAFGGGTMTDFCCHHIDLSHWALDLRHPLTVESEGPPVDEVEVPVWMISTFNYPARGSKPPVKLVWYQGAKRPPLPECAKDSWPDDGTLFVGSKGKLQSSYGKHRLLPEADFKDFVAPTPFIPTSIGHHKEWFEACKTGGSTTSNFDYAGALTETGILGNVAFRVGKKIEWDTNKLRATNCPEAEKFIQHHYRKGWSI
ncbi:MAG: Gfo/Idh/MocA family oxidoreductase [Verrucomicrobiota bacterium]